MNSSVTNGGFTPLHFAASRGQLSCMKALVAAGGDVHGGDRAGECPLHVAVRCDSIDTVEWLLAQVLCVHFICITHQHLSVYVRVAHCAGAYQCIRQRSSEKQTRSCSAH